MPSIESFDEDGHAPINSPLDPPRLVAVLDWQWCETCWTDKHHECHGKGADMQAKGIEQKPLTLAA